MSLKERLLPLFKEKGSGYLSGEEAAVLLGVSRSAVWKAVSALKEDGYRIEAVTNRGYKLIDSGDVLSAPEIQKHLDDCIDYTSILIFRGFVGSTDFRSSLCTVLVHLIL